MLSKQWGEENTSGSGPSTYDLTGWPVFEFRCASSLCGNDYHSTGRLRPIDNGAPVMQIARLIANVGNDGDPARTRWQPYLSILLPTRQQEARWRSSPSVTEARLRLKRASVGSSTSGNNSSNLDCKIIIIISKLLSMRLISSIVLPLSTRRRGIYDKHK